MMIIMKKRNKKTMRKENDLVTLVKKKDVRLTLLSFFFLSIDLFVGTIN